MSVNDNIRKALESYGGFSINERVYNYLGSLGYTGTISDRLAKYWFEDKKGWQALIARYASSGWTPAALFAQGQQGVWYEPKPKPQYLYQDAAGTVPVTADGDPVGYMQDLSGNGNHATQSTSASRPIYRTDGTLHWLEFDGVDDQLSIPLPFNLTNTFEMSMAYTPSSVDFIFVPFTGTIYSGIGQSGSTSTSLSGGIAEIEEHWDNVISSNDTRGDNYLSFQESNVYNFKGRLASDRTTGKANGIATGAAFPGVRNQHALIYRSGQMTETERERWTAYAGNLAGVTL